MSIHRSLLRRAAGLALLAALALALLPALSRALQPVALAADLATLCRSDDGGGVAHALDRCGHCLLAAAPWLPAAVPARAPVPEGHAEAVRPLPPGRPDGPVRAAAPARAPPAA